MSGAEAKVPGVALDPVRGFRYETPTLDAPGCEWIVDARGCPPEPLRQVDVLGALFARIVEELELHPVGAASWHVFPGGGGVTGFQMLAESHLACHTFPERGFAAVNLYCCRPRPEWRWEERLRELLGAREVSVRRIERGAP